MRRFRDARRVLAVVVSTPLLTLGSIGGVVTPGPSMRGDAAHADGNVTIDGHGYGHGIGLSQYGALGYAVDFGWSSDQILDHYYGGTVSSTTPPRDITVRITRLDGQQTAVVHDRGAAVVEGVAPLSGQPGAWRSLVAREVSEGHYRVWGRTDVTSCPPSGANLDDAAAGWTVVVADQPVSVTFRPSTDTSASADPSDLLGLCEPNTGRVRSYRGAVRAVNDSSGANRTVNQAPMEQYLRSVVAGEVSTGWAARGGGRGVQALQAQAVAARSYGAAENKAPYAQTCDDNCQTYRGAGYRSGVGGAFVAQEYAQTDAAVAATAGVVRRYGSQTGAVAYTMFSSSSGGFTATNPFGFTPVIDEGDAIADNAGHTWSTTLEASAIEHAYPSIGSFSAIEVTSRDGHGEWGGRVLMMKVAGSAATVEVTGAAFRSAVGLRSTWFRVRGATDAAPAGTGGPGRPGSAADACGGRDADLVAGTSVDTSASWFTPVTPVRLVDTRIGVGTDAVPLGSGCTLEISPRVAPGSTAVVVNVTAVEPAVNGHLTAYPCGAEKPLASIVPIVAGRIVPGTAVVPLNPEGKFCVFSSVETQLVVDLSGVYTPGLGQPFQPVIAQRRYDSRALGRVPAETVVRVRVAGTGGIPSTSTAVAVTVHSSNADADGFVTVWPCDAERPTTSVLNATAATSVTNHTQVGLDSDGGVCMYGQTTMDLVLDVSGWFGPEATASFHPLLPYRLMDTRDDVGLAGAFHTGQNRAISVVGAGGVPATGVQAIAAEVTSVDAMATGFITVHPCLTPVPTISMVRNVAHTTAATTVTGIVDGAGRWCLQTNTPMHVLVDVSGWYG